MYTVNTGHAYEGEPCLTVAQLARAAGVSPHTVRYYERQGLLPPAQRDTMSGYRRYRPGEVERLRFIRTLKELGFPLREIREILRLASSPDSCSTVRRLAMRRLAEVRTRIAGLERCAAALEQVMERCARGRAGPCHLFAPEGETTGSAPASRSQTVGE